MPGFGHDAGDLHDLGILLLPAGSVPAGTPAVRLPTAGYLDQLKAAGTLKFRVADLGRLRARMARPDRADVGVGFRCKRADRLGGPLSAKW